MGPLVPAEVDLRGMPYMPLDVNRLRDSQLAIGASGDEFRAAVLLWCTSWNQVPAASLPSDDQSLAVYAGYGRDLKSWKKVKEGAMRGFLLCDDGRWYHPVVAEKAIEAWGERSEYREEQQNKDDRKKRERAWRKEAFAALRAVGITAEWDIKTTDLRKLIDQHGLAVKVTQSMQDTVDVTPPVTPVTRHVTAPVTDLSPQQVTANKGREGILKAPHSPPVGGVTADERKQTFRTWLASLPDDADVIPEGHHVLTYAESVGMPREFVELAWVWFSRKYTVEKPRARYADWLAHFRNAVEGRWGNLWWIDGDGRYQITTQGQQLQRSVEAASK